MKQKHKKSLQQAKNSSNKKSVSDKNLSQPSSKRFLIFAHILIIALGFIAYFNSLNGKFLYDDPILIENNAFIKNPSELINCFTKDLYAGLGAVSNFYRPLQVSSYSIDYAIFKLDVRGYHLINMLLHIAVAVCVFWFINVLFSNNLLSLITAILYVVHPIHTEAVSYISGRCDPLAGLFMLLCMIVYIKSQAQERIHLYFFILISFICALISKESSIILPLLLLIYHFVFAKRIKAVPFLSLVGVAVIFIVLRFPHLKAVPHTDTVFDRIPGIFVALSTYIKLLFVPVGLHMEYGSKLFDWGQPKVIIGFILTLIIVILGYIKRNNKIILFSLLWFFLGLLPVSNLYKINFFMAEHFLYLPSIGFFLIIAYMFSLLYNDQRYKVIAIILITACVAFFLILTIRQNRYWRDPFTFYKRTLEFNQDSVGVYNNLGKIYQEKGDLRQALSDYNKSIELSPINAEVYNNRGNVYAQIGNYGQAILDFNKAIELNPHLAVVYQNCGNAYGKKGDYAQAILDFNKAIELNLNDPEDYNNRGNAYAYMGNFDQAILDFSRAIEFKSDFAQAYNNRFMAYYFQKEYDKAWADLHQALGLGARVDPRFVEALKKSSGRDE